MVGRSPATAANRYREAMQRAVSCVTDALLSVHGGYHPAERPHGLSFGGNGWARLQGSVPTRLRVIQNYRLLSVEGQRRWWRVEIVAYFYILADADGRELLAYHWHPESISRVGAPHLHLGPWASAGLEAFPRAHFPGGALELGEFIRFLIEELGIPPLRQDWRDALEPSPAAP